MYQSTIAQIYTLCTHGSSLLGGSDRNKMVVARIFWYAYVHEGESPYSPLPLSRVLAVIVIRCSGLQQVTDPGPAL